MIFSTFDVFHKRRKDYPRRATWVGTLPRMAYVNRV
jgi:hypothetical protein